MTGGVTGLAGVIILGPRIGKFNKDGSANAIPGHNIPMVALGTLILAFGWFGFNPGSTLAATDLRIGSVATCTMLASAAGCLTAMFYMWAVFGKPDPTMACNGLLAGLVAITAPSAFVNPVGAVIIGAIAGVLVVWGVLFVERVLKVDDPVGAIAVHGVNGALGCLSIGLFATGEYGAGWNGVATAPTGIFYGGGFGQLAAEAIGVVTNFVWVFSSAFVFFWIIDKTMGNARLGPDRDRGARHPRDGRRRLCQRRYHARPARGRGAPLDPRAGRAQGEEGHRADHRRPLLIPNRPMRPSHAEAPSPPGKGPRSFPEGHDPPPGRDHASLPPTSSRRGVTGPPRHPDAKARRIPPHILPSMHVR